MVKITTVLFLAILIEAIFIVLIIIAIYTLKKAATQPYWEAKRGQYAIIGTFFALCTITGMIWTLTFFHLSISWLTLSILLLITLIIRYAIDKTTQ